MSLSAVRRRLGDEGGFTMGIALGVLTVTTLLMAAAFVAAKGDIGNSQHDLEGKRAYYAARAGLNTFLYQLNKDPELWKSCPTQSTKPIPGQGTANEKYSYQPLPANGKSKCLASDPVHTLIDVNSGSFRMQFTGTSGNPAVSRTLVATFRRGSTLDYLYYSVYETLDPNTESNPAAFQKCAKLRRDGRDRDRRPGGCGTINWVTGDEINGPMYTKDQLAICGSPTFGRPGRDDDVSTPATPATTNGEGGIYKSDDTGCTQSARLNGDLNEGAADVSPPSDNASLQGYATTDGTTFSGETWVTLSGSTAKVINNNQPVKTIDLSSKPIIYVTNSSSCSNASYSPYGVTYPASTTKGGCGNVYVHGSYSSSVTIAAANDIVIDGNLTTDLSGGAVAGLVANNFIRIKHGVTSRYESSQKPGTEFGQCGNASNVSSQTLQSVRIDAAVLALKHSFIVDNYDCGAAMSGKLTVDGAIAQLFRGTVGTTSGGNASTGYIKNYNYDDRLKYLQPPFLFNLAEASWTISRETGCVAGGPAGVAC